MKKALTVFTGLLVAIFAVVAVVGYIMLSPKESTRPENPLVTGVSYIGLTVSDAAKTAQLYGLAADMAVVGKDFSMQDLPSLAFEKNDTQRNPLVETKLISSVNAQLLLMEFESPKDAYITPVNGPGIAHICFQVNQATETYQTFLSNGSSHIGDPELQQINPKNPVYYAYIRDPDGILIEVEHVDVAALNLESPPKHDYRIRQISLATPNMQRLIDFYSVILEEDHPRRIGRLRQLSGEKVDAISGLPGSEIEMAWFQLRNLELEIIQYHSHQSPQSVPKKPVSALGYNAIVFDVENIQMIASVLAEVGAVIELPPRKTDSGWIMYARDPDNNLLGFQQFEEASPLSAERFKGNGI